MPSLSLRLLALQAISGLGSLTNALAIMPTTPSPYEGLTPREITLADGTVATIYENRALTFHSAPASEPAPPNKAKRFQYVTYTGLGRNDYCGEWSGPVTGGASAPLASDCHAIALAYTRQTSFGADAVLGYWAISAADWAAAPGGWITLAASGTCKFPIALGWGQAPQAARFGANDLRFYMNWVTGQAVGGKSESSGGVSCWNGTDGVFTDTSFRVTHV